MDNPSLPTPVPARASAIPRLSRLPVPKTFTRPGTGQGSHPNGQPAVNPPRPQPSMERPPPLFLKSSSHQPKTAGYLRSTAASAVRSKEEQGNPTVAPLRRSDGSNSSRSPTSTYSPQRSPVHTNPSDKAAGPARKPRPSLSDRTIESLALIPPSPIRRRKSNFFDPAGSLAVPRPGSSASRTTSRPGTSDETLRPRVAAAGSTHATPTKFNTAVLQGGLRPAARTELNFSTRTVQSAHTTPTAKFNTAVLKGGLRSATRTELDFPTRAAKSTNTTPTTKFNTAVLRGGIRPAARTELNYPTGSPLPANRAGASTSRRPPILNGSKSMSATPRKPRPAISEMFNPPTDNAIPPVPKLSATKNIASNTPDKTSKSSAALRDQIRKAKAARKSDVASTQGSKTVASGYSTDAQSDPFNQLPKLGTSLLKRRIDMARTDGRLNLIAMGLQEFPPEVLKMYDFEANADSSVPWGEAVDLTRFNVADNDLKAIPDELFPDVDMANVDNNEEVDLPQFGGIEVLDLHGNLLRTLPMGLRRLERLTSLNLTRNNLDDNVFEVISQIKPLRDLKLSECSLSGTLPESIGQLHALKTLDLSGNKLTALPDSMQSLTHLRILDVSQNKLTSLSLSILQSCPLRDLLATKNSLAGTLFPPSVPGHPRLERLVVSCNSLTSLTPLPTLALPSLATLDFSVNRITALPDLAACPQLTALLAEDNKLTELPRGFTALARLKSADFTGNDLRVIDEEVGLMEALVSLRVAANPLRDRKFLTMGAEEIKKDLRGRLAPDLNF